jgi:3-hydroxy-9,10-secoandrosta-1,3,5(10)-triene-9,17-dione monooxygenase reductase component
MTTVLSEQTHSGPDPAHYRKVLGRVPTAVSVVTANNVHGPAGLTVGSFTSVSLDPPLVVFFFDLTSTSAPAIVAAGRFCVNVLAEDQQEVAVAFAGPAANRFASCTQHPGRNGAPRLDRCCAWIECDLERSFPVGDHRAVLGTVRHLEAAPGGRRPLVFCRGRFPHLDRAQLWHLPTDSFDWWE